jgi:hypothetical protein
MSIINPMFYNKIRYDLASHRFQWFIGHVILVSNICPCLFVELGELKAPVKTSEIIDPMSYFVP